MNPKTWIFALGQAFFSLSVAGNGTLIYGSYLSDEEDIPASAARVALFDTIAAILAALVIIPAMATTGAQLNQGGPGLLFVYLPNLIKSMPGSTLIAMIFFVAVLFAGMTSLITSMRPRLLLYRKITRWKKGSLSHYCRYRCSCIFDDSGNCIRLDGCPFNLYLPSWRRTGRNYVLLDSW